MTIADSSISLVHATPELKTLLKERWESNASDFIRFDENYISLVALAGANPIGLIVAKSRGLSAPLQAVEEAFIDVIEVLPEYRRKGIGTALVEKVIAWAHDHHVSQIRAWSEETRYEALMLWNKLGFTFSQVDFRREDGEHYGFYVAKKL